MKKKNVFWKAILVLAILVGMAGCGSKSEPDLEWPVRGMATRLPKLEGQKGNVLYNTDDSLSMTVKEFSESQFDEYIQACIDAGFNQVAENGTTKFEAYDSEEYKLELRYYSNHDLDIHMEAPVEFGNLEWPSKGLAAKLPKVTKKKGNITSNDSNSFYVLVDEVSVEEFKKYVKSCKSKGFTKNVDEGDDYFYGTDKKGYEVSVHFEDLDHMRIEISKPEKEEKDDSSDTTEVSNNTVRKEFKKAMESYEKFFDKYVKFMKKYNKSTNPTKLMSEYLEILDEYETAMSELEALDDGTLTDAELKLYTKTMNSINKKIASIYE